MKHKKPLRQSKQHVGKVPRVLIVQEWLDSREQYQKYRDHEKMTKRRSEMLYYWAGRKRGAYRIHVRLMRILREKVKQVPSSWLANDSFAS